MELLEEELTCPICTSIYEDPRVLPCSHSFCKKCLEGILEGSRSIIWRQPFKCPTCRKDTPHNGAQSLQVNYSLRAIVEKYNKIRVSPKMFLCREHSEQPLNIFCETDFRLICGFCATTGSHIGHKFCALEEAYEKERKAFEELFRGVQKFRSADVNSSLEALEKNKKKALHLLSVDAQKVTDYFEKLTRSVEQKKNEILSDFEMLKLTVMQAYDPEISKLRAVLGEQKQALRLAETFRNGTDPLPFLQQMQEFREKLDVIRNTSLPSHTYLDVATSINNFNVKDLDVVRLKDVDKIATPHEQRKACRWRAWFWWGLVLTCPVFLGLCFLRTDLRKIGMPNLELPSLNSFAHVTECLLQCQKVLDTSYLWLSEMLEKCAIHLRH